MRVCQFRHDGKLHLCAAPAWATFQERTTRYILQRLPCLSNRLHIALITCVKRRTTIGMVSDATKKGVSYL